MKLSNYITSLRRYRVWHRWTGLALAAIIVISALSGILLSWKKEVDWIQPPTQRGESATLHNWLPLDSLAALAASAYARKFPGEPENAIDRMDVRPGKGVVKVLFENGWWEIQLDGHTGAVHSIARRHSDWIEQLHDGSIIADWFKLLTMNVLGIGLLVMLVSGWWLWYGPRRIRKIKKDT